MRLEILNPTGCRIPRWSITYSEVPSEISYESPMIAVNIFGRVADWRSKEVRMELVAKGFADTL